MLMVVDGPRTLGFVNCMNVRPNMLLHDWVSVMNRSIKVKAVLEVKLGLAVCTSADFLVDTFKLSVSRVNRVQVLANIGFLT